MNITLKKKIKDSIIKCKMPTVVDFWTKSDIESKRYTQMMMFQDKSGSMK